MKKWILVAVSLIGLATSAANAESFSHSYPQDRQNFMEGGGG